MCLIHLFKSDAKPKPLMNYAIQCPRTFGNKTILTNLYKQLKSRIIGFLTFYKKPKKVIRLQEHLVYVWIQNQSDN